MNWRKKMELSARLGRLEMNLSNYRWFSNSETWRKTIEAEDDLAKLDKLENFGSVYQ